MMTAASIPASRSAGYADYLDGKTLAPARGDYYLGRDGLPAEAPGRWLVDRQARVRVGVQGATVGDLRALMEGRRPGDGDEPDWLRQAGPDGTRAGGVDVTFSAPKGVSVLWALGDRRAEIEAAHRTAVAAAVDYLRESVEVTVRYEAAVGGAVPAVAAHLHAAEFVHTTARGVGADVPDPQLHSHVVITSVERVDGSVAAVRSRPVLRAAREVGAFYRAQLAAELRTLGYVITPAGKDGRYFAVDGIERRVEQCFSSRAEEVERAGREFRATHGRDPARGELRALAVRTRAAKLPRTRDDLDRSWLENARRLGLSRERIDELQHGRRVEQPEWTAWAACVERSATRTRATFTLAELRAVALEHAAGHGIPPREALNGIEILRDRGRILGLADGRLTTAAVREAERAIERDLVSMATRQVRAIDVTAVRGAVTQVEERLGNALSAEQRHAVQTLTSQGRAVVLIGPAGTGKGVVIEAATCAELAAGREVYGLAVAGRTAQRLGETAPALQGRVKTIDAFVNGVERGHLRVDHLTTIYLDEAGMGDTERLRRLVAMVEQSGASLVAVGDPRQLPSVGAGGMFARLAQTLPVAELSEVHRARDLGEVAAWRELRAGDPSTALTHYRDQSRLHFADTRVESVERAAQRYAQLSRELGHERVALMSDASNIEIDTLNLRVQTLRREHGELSAETVARDDGQAFHAEDRVTWRRPMHLPGDMRVENGARGTVMNLDVATHEMTVRLDGSGREIRLSRDQLGALRLAYAGHVYRQQGATVDRAIVLTGGWQTSREGTYVHATRARDGVEWHLARDELDGVDDRSRIEHLAKRIGLSRAQVPSLDHELATPPAVEQSLDRARERGRGLEIDFGP